MSTLSQDFERFGFQMVFKNGAHSGPVFETFYRVSLDRVTRSVRGYNNCITVNVEKVLHHMIWISLDCGIQFYQLELFTTNMRNQTRASAMD